MGKVAKANSLSIVGNDLFYASFPGVNVVFSALKLKKGMSKNGPTQVLLGYINIPGTKIKPGFYLIEISTKKGEIQPKAQLQNLKGEKIRNLKFEIKGEVSGGPEIEVTLDSVSHNEQPNGNIVTVLDGRVKVHNVWRHYWLYIK